jgi:protein TonB
VERCKSHILALAEIAMFQDVLVESSGRLKTRSGSLNIVAICLNVAVLLAFVLWPLLNPMALPRQALTRLLVAPAPPSAPAHAAVAIRKTAAKVEPLIAQMEVPSVIPRMISAAPGSDLSQDQGVFPSNSIPGGLVGSPGDVLSSMGHAATPTVVRALPNRLAISSGVMAGNKIAGEMPAYSAIAKAARIQGTVTLQATISKTGSIENLRVQSGPPMLAASAIQAVSTWRYRPYLLNGQPVEVETTINVVFNLAN